MILGVVCCRCLLGLLGLPDKPFFTNHYPIIYPLLSQRVTGMKKLEEIKHLHFFFREPWYVLLSILRVLSFHIAYIHIYPQPVPLCSWACCETSKPTETMCHGRNLVGPGLQTVSWSNDKLRNE